MRYGVFFFSCCRLYHFCLTLLFSQTVALILLYLCPILSTYVINLSGMIRVKVLGKASSTEDDFKSYSASVPSLSCAFSVLVASVFHGHIWFW